MRSGQRLYDASAAAQASAACADTEPSTPTRTGRRPVLSTAVVFVMSPLRFSCGYPRGSTVPLRCRARYGNDRRTCDRPDSRRPATMLYWNSARTPASIPRGGREMSEYGRLPGLSDSAPNSADEAWLTAIAQAAAGDSQAPL